jgi:MoxR-like ATPase
MPNREDPFAPTVPGQQAAMPEWTVDSAMEFLMQEYGDEFQIELKHTTEHTPDMALVEKTMMDNVDQSVTIRQGIEVDYNVKFEEIAEAYSTTRDTVDEVITHLTSGKNIMLFGEPGTGKTALSNILLTKLCGEIDQPNGSKAPNYTIVTANAEWSNFDVIGGISPDDSGGYYFKDGYVAEAAKLCEKSIVETGRPHYLVIDEFNRANIDEAFGKLFTVFEYRDKQPLLTHKETGGAPFMMPPEFRIIGTMNTQDKNTLFNVGFALMRRFAFVEIGLPDPSDEYNRMPVFVYFKLKKLGLVPERPQGDDLWKFGEKCKHFPSRKFDFYDDDGNMYKCHEKLVKFLAPDEVPKRGDEVAVGVRTFRKIGPALLIDSMVTIFNSIQKYGPELALDKVIRSNIMPSLEGLERSEIRCLFLKAKEVLGPDSIVTETFDRMANSDSLSLF